MSRSKSRSRRRLWPSTHLVAVPPASASGDKLPRNRLEISEPPQGAEAWKKAIFSATCNYEPRQTLEPHS